MSTLDQYIVKDQDATVLAVMLQTPVQKLLLSQQELSLANVHA